MPDKGPLEHASSPELEGMPPEERAQILRIRELTQDGRMTAQEAIYQVRREDNEAVVRLNAGREIDSPASPVPQQDLPRQQAASHQPLPARSIDPWTHRGGLVPQQEAAMASLRRAREAQSNDPEPEPQIDPAQAERELSVYEDRTGSRPSHVYGELKLDHAEAAHEEPSHDSAPEQQPEERTLTFFEDRAGARESRHYGELKHEHAEAAHDEPTQEPAPEHEPEPQGPTLIFFEDRVDALRREHSALTEEAEKIEGQEQEQQLTFFEDLHPETRDRGWDLSR